MTAVSKKDLSFVRCLALQKFAGSIRKQSFATQKWSMLLVRKGFPGVGTVVIRDMGIGPVRPLSMFPHVA